MLLTCSEKAFSRRVRPLRPRTRTASDDTKRRSFNMSEAAMPKHMPPAN